MSMDICLMIVLAVFIIFLFYGSTETVIREGLASSGNPWGQPNADLIPAGKTGTTSYSPSCAIPKPKTATSSRQFAAPFCPWGGQGSNCIWPGPSVPTFYKGHPSRGGYPAQLPGWLTGARGMSLGVVSPGQVGAQHGTYPNATYDWITSIAAAKCSLGSPDGLYTYINGQDSWAHNYKGASPPSPWQKGSPFWLRVDKNNNSWTISLAGDHGKGPWLLVAHNSAGVEKGRWQSPGAGSSGSAFAWGGVCQDPPCRACAQPPPCVGHFDYNPNQNMCHQLASEAQIADGTCDRWLPVANSGASGIVGVLTCQNGGDRDYPDGTTGLGCLNPAEAPKLGEIYCATSGLTCPKGQSLLDVGCKVKVSVGGAAVAHSEMIQDPSSTLCIDVAVPQSGPPSCPNSAANIAACCSNSWKCPGKEDFCRALACRCQSDSDCDSGHCVAPYIGGRATCQSHPYSPPAPPPAASCRPIYGAKNCDDFIAADKAAAHPEGVTCATIEAQGYDCSGCACGNQGSGPSPPPGAGNVCTCPHGTPVTGSACTVNNAAQCLQCDSGYKLSSGVGSSCISAGAGPPNGKLSGQNRITPASFTATFDIAALSCDCSKGNCACKAPVK